MDSRRYLSRKEARGTDDIGRAYRTIEELWEEEKREEWYKRANDYWSSQDPTIETVLGGIQEIHKPDIEESSVFIDHVLSEYSIRRGWVLDCGAGIGRVTKFLLAPRFESVDLLEQCQKFIDYARTFVETEKVKNFYAVGAQDFDIQPGKYDLIWVQWVLSQLTDHDLVTFLNNIKTGVAQGGVIIIKENFKEVGFLVHRDDHSVTRSEKSLKHFFKLCGLTVLYEKQQQEWPEDLMQIKMFALTKE